MLVKDNFSFYFKLPERIRFTTWKVLVLSSPVQMLGASGGPPHMGIRGSGGTLNKSPCHAHHREFFLFSIWVLRLFCEYHKAVMRLLLIARLHCTSQRVFVFNISLEIFLWTSRESGETLTESSPILYLIGSVCIFNISLEILLWTSRGSVKLSLKAPLYYT